MQHPLLRLISVSMLLLAATATGLVSAAEPTAATVDASYIPADFHGGAYINVRRLVASPLYAELKLGDRIPKGSVFAVLGVENIRHIVSAGKFPESWTRGGIAAQQQAVAVRATTAINVADLAKKLGLVAAEKAGRHETYRIGLGAALQYCAFPEERTMLLASDASTLAAMLSAKETADSLFLNQLTSLPADRDLGLVASFEPLRATLAKLARDNPAPTPFQAINDLPDQIRALTASVDLSGPKLLDINILAYDEEAAGKLKSTLEEYLGLAESLWVLNARRVIQSVNDEGYEDFAKTLAPFVKEFFEIRSVGSREKTVTATWRRPESTDALVKTIPDMVRDVIRAVERSARGQRLGYVGKAIEAYRAKHGHYPRPAIYDKAGKPLLSWRVAVLPYQDEESASLYKEFRLDEPWDSPHNKPLLARMPLNYRGTEDRGGNTRLLAVVGDEAVFTDATGKLIEEIPDGPDGTILVVEVGADKAVPWTKPAEFVIDKSSPKANLGKLDRFRHVGFWTLLANSSCVLLSASADDATLVAMFTRNGGEIIDWGKVQRFENR